MIHGAYLNGCYCCFDRCPSSFVAFFPEAEI
jgi:hypothetical protein